MTQEKVIELALRGHNILLTGDAGTGKTYTVTAIAEKLTAQGKNVALTASTGVAATLLNGFTIHSFSMIGIKKQLESDDLYKMRHARNFERLKNTDVLIIDEFSMLDPEQFSCVEQVFRFAKANGEFFGGIQVILCGDFFQLPPVSIDKPAKFAFETTLLEDGTFKTCYLNKIYRQTDGEFLDILNSIRSDSVSNYHRELLKTKCNNELPDAIKIFSSNAEVDRENLSHFSKIQSQEYVFTAEIFGDKLIAERDILGKWNNAENVSLKVGTKIMCIVNRYEDETKDFIFCNGTQGKVIGFSEGEGFCFPIIETSDGEIITVTPHRYKVLDPSKKGEDGKPLELAAVEQIPLRQAWAITIHKSQGATFDKAEIDLKNVFMTNQGYVAISRCRSLAGLYIKNLKFTSFKIALKVLGRDESFRMESAQNETM